MSAPVNPAPAVPIRVPAGTTAAAAVSEAGLPRRGAPDAIVVVRDAEGKLRDLSWVPGADAEVIPVAANTDEGRQCRAYYARSAQAPPDGRPATVGDCLALGLSALRFLSGIALLSPTQ